MKKRLFRILSISLMLTFILSICASAVTPRWTFLYSITPDISKSNDTYGIIVNADTSVTSIDVELVLKKKGLLGVYTKKASYSATINNCSGRVFSTYDMSTNDEYKLIATITAKTSSGQSETVTVEHTV